MEIPVSPERGRVLDSVLILAMNVRGGTRHTGWRPEDIPGTSRGRSGASPVSKSRFQRLLPAAALAGTHLAWLALLASPLMQQAAREWLAGDIGATFALLCVVLFGVGLLGCG